VLACTTLKLPAYGESTHLLWHLSFYAKFISGADSNVATFPELDVRFISNPLIKIYVNVCRAHKTKFSPDP
jgi:hypothetical protein